MYCGIYPTDGHNVARSRKPDGPGEDTAATPAGPSPGRPTAARSTTAPPPIRPASRGPSARRWCGGTRQREDGPAPTCRISSPTKPPRLPPGLEHASARHGRARRRRSVHHGGRRQVPAVRAVRAEGRAAADPLRAGGKPGRATPSTASSSIPSAKLWTPARATRSTQPEDPRFPYVFTTYRLTELHCGGIIGRVTPHTAELQPEAFVEISPELADELGIAQSRTGPCCPPLRGEIEVRAMVTERMRPFTIDGRVVHQVGMPWVYGWEGYARGDIANVLLAITGDANTSIHSTKAVTCTLRPGRLANPAGASAMASEAPGHARSGCTRQGPGGTPASERPRAVARRRAPRRRSATRWSPIARRTASRAGAAHGNWTTSTPSSASCSAAISRSASAVGRTGQGARLARRGGRDDRGASASGKRRMMRWR